MFKKGVCPNPRGRGLPGDDLKRIVKKLLSAHYKEAVQKVVDQLGSGDRDCEQWAVKMILEYSIGKPAQAVEISGEGGGPLVAVIKDA